MRQSIAGFLCAAGIPLVLAAQTQLDLRTQSKSMDFEAAQYTKPFQTGATLPSMCAQGAMFFLTTATAGANLYGCSSTNTWVPQAGGGGGGVISIENTGTLVGSLPILNLSVGPGVLLATSDSGQTIAIQTGLDTSYVQTLTSGQGGGSLLCSPASGSGTTYTCAMSPTLTAYTSGMILHWKPDVTAAGGSTTLNIDTLGPAPVKLPDGISNPAAADVEAGRMLEIWYDGAAFRLMAPETPAGVLGEAQPVCGLAVRGRLWFVPGATGVKDGLSVCARDAISAYAWRVLY